eukprot:COSAG01_NODE_10253_length_2209_cov_2.851659_1_plen_98_part_10
MGGAAPKPLKVLSKAYDDATAVYRSSFKMQTDTVKELHALHKKYEEHSGEAERLHGLLMAMEHGRCSMYSNFEVSRQPLRQTYRQRSGGGGGGRGRGG